MRDTKFRTRLFLCFLAVIVMTLVLPGLHVRKNIKEDGIDETVRNARREAVLAAREAQLAQEQAELADQRADFEQGKKSLLDNGDKNFVNPKEKLYDKFPLTVHQMDIIIGVLFALLLLLLVMGMTHTSFFGLFGG